MHSYKVWRDLWEIIQERRLSVELMARPFTVLTYCSCLLLHMIIHSKSERRTEVTFITGWIIVSEWTYIVLHFVTFDLVKHHFSRHMFHHWNLIRTSVKISSCYVLCSWNQYCVCLILVSECIVTPLTIRIHSWTMDS